VEKEQAQSVRFRFLNHEEFADLSQSERISYLQLAVEALRGGNPEEIPPTKDRH
jgi:hypothetical protein